MSDARGGEDTSVTRHDQYAEYGPYGAGAHELGRDALRLAAHLSASGHVPEAEDARPLWDPTDEQALDDYVAFQESIAFIEPNRDVDGGDIGDLFRKFHRLHAAMPFSEGERRWLLDFESDPALRLDRRLVAGLADVQTTVLSAGIWQPLDGRQLIRKWAAWRRQCDEFAGQGSLAIAHELLESIVKQVLPPRDIERERDDLELADKPAFPTQS